MKRSAIVLAAAAPAAAGLLALGAAGCGDHLGDPPAVKPGGRRDRGYSWIRRNARPASHSTNPASAPASAMSSQN